MEKMVQDPAMLFRALADETRLKMLALIQRYGELCVCDVMTVLAVTQSKASRHLRYLLNAGLLKDRRETVWAFYRLADDLDPVRKAIVDSVPQLLDKAVLDKMDKKMKVWSHLKCCAYKAKAAGAEPDAAEVGS
jgi:ArsR family transcriptional regulator, arsenate/arsenite/antimonite-responsive transcriptional repressor